MRTNKLFGHLLVGTILLALSLTVGVPRAGAQTKAAGVQETDDEVKVNLYTRFRDNYNSNKTVAYQIAKDYLQRYAKDNDQYSNYVQMWVAAYEVDGRLKQLRNLVYNERKFAEAFKLGKQVMAESPDSLDSLIALGSAGALAAAARDETFNAEGINYSQKAIQLIEGGKAPTDWTPFKGKDDTLAYLYSTIGLLKLKTAPNDAINPLIKSLQFESELRKVPSTYYYLAIAYETGPYARMSADYQAKYAGKPETTESKQALEQLNQIIDRMIDAYARAVAAAGNDPQNAANKTAWQNKLTTFYKFRHNDSDAGLNEMIAGILSKPLPPRP